MKLYHILGLLIALFTSSCTAQEIPSGYFEESITQEVIKELENKAVHNLEKIPTVIMFNDDPDYISSDNLLDRFPFRRKEEKDKAKESEETGVIFDGHIIKKIKDVIITSLDSLSFMISISLYLFPIAIILYFAGFFLYGMSSSVHGAASLKRGIQKFRDKYPYNVEKE